MKQHQVIIDPKRCVGCGVCKGVCAAHNLVIDQNKARTVWDDCILCGHCAAICPKQAISISGLETEQVENKSAVRLNPQEVLDVIRFRRTIRRFQQKEIPQEVIGQILEAGRLTHTAKNMQDVSFVVLGREKDRVEQMAVGLFRKIKPLAGLFSKMAKARQIDDHFFFFGAPIVLVVLAKNQTNGILAAQNMEFVAEAHGLGVLYSGFFTMAANHSRSIKKALQIPTGKRVAMTLVLGYPAVKYLRSAPRKNLEVKYL